MEDLAAQPSPAQPSPALGFLHLALSAPVPQNLREGPAKHQAFLFHAPLVYS